MIEQNYETYYTVREVAEEVGLPAQTIRVLIRHGQMSRSGRGVVESRPKTIFVHSMDLQDLRDDIITTKRLYVRWRQKYGAERD
jgi:predicted transcriptional regulator